MRIVVVLLVVLHVEHVASSELCFAGAEDTSSTCVFPCHCVGACNRNNGGCDGGCATGWWNNGCQIGNVAKDKAASQTGESEDGAEQLIDGIRETCSNLTSWQVDLAQQHAVKNVSIYLREDLQNAAQADICVSDERESCTNEESCRTVTINDAGSASVSCRSILVGRYLTIKEITAQAMLLCEVEVFGFVYSSCNVRGNVYKWGPGCLNLCHCAEQCDQISGVCPRGSQCIAGWRRDPNGVCRDLCDDDEWGADCSEHCNCQGTCNKQNGKCSALCDVGYYGSNCQSECIGGTWGAGNSTACPNDCHCSVICNRRNGNCDGRCHSGYRGRDCSMRCSPGMWGSGCNQTCNCFGDNDVCDPETGHCSTGCKQWYVGSSCNVPLITLANDSSVHVVHASQDTATVQLVHNITRDDISITEYLVQHRAMNTSWSNTSNTDVMLKSSNMHLIIAKDLPQKSVVHIRFVPVIHVSAHLLGYAEDSAYLGGPSAAVAVTTDCIDGLWGEMCEHKCHCKDVQEICNKTTGFCVTGCSEHFSGSGCVDLDHGPIKGLVIGLVFISVLFFVAAVIILALIVVRYKLVDALMAKIRKCRQQLKDEKTVQEKNQASYYNIGGDTQASKDHEENKKKKETDSILPIYENANKDTKEIKTKETKQEDNLSEEHTSPGDVPSQLYENTNPENVPGVSGGKISTNNNTEQNAKSKEASAAENKKDAPLSASKPPKKALKPPVKQRPAGKQKADILKDLVRPGRPDPKRGPLESYAELSRPKVHVYENSNKYTGLKK